VEWHTVAMAAWPRRQPALQPISLARCGANGAGGSARTRRNGGREELERDAAAMANCISARRRMAANRKGKRRSTADCDALRRQGRGRRECRHLLEQATGATARPDAKNAVKGHGGGMTRSCMAAVPSDTVAD
jgi:hypothetical protein